MKENYEINSSTVAIIPIEAQLSEVIELDNTFLVNRSASEIIDDSCKYFGSSFVGRQEGTKNLIGVNYKSPIIIEESLELIFFPTASPRTLECMWISLNHIADYNRNGLSSSINFKNLKKIELEISYGSLENQILRATRLESILRKRKLA